MDSLTLARAGLYHAILSRISPDGDLANGALDSLRHGGDWTFLAPGLLTRAWTLTVLGERDEAIVDLDEAWDVAALGPMRLHQTNIPLYRARFFHDQNPYPWESPTHDVDRAQRLIIECGYHRRQELLEYTRTLIES